MNNFSCYPILTFFSITSKSYLLYSNLLADDMSRPLSAEYAQLSFINITVWVPSVVFNVRCCSALRFRLSGYCFEMTQIAFASQNDVTGQAEQAGNCPLRPVTKSRSGAYAFASPALSGEPMRTH